jgi:cytochrome c nitrite reductase small subunit
VAFTLGDVPDVIRARPGSTAVVEANCKRCHTDLVDSMTHGGDVSCIRCHASVGHVR